MKQNQQVKDSRYLMALDAGTGSVRAVIFNLDGEQISVGQEEWTHIPAKGIAGSMEFELSKNWALVCSCIKQALYKANVHSSAIQAISTCSMREGIVIYDKNHEPIWACANVDARAGDQVASLKQLNNGLFESEAYHITGQTFALGALPRLVWLKENRSDIYEQAYAMTMISDWMANRLCGELAVDPSNAGTTGILDLQTRSWSHDLLSTAGLRNDFLPDVKETGTVLGYVSEKAAHESGLSAGIPVVMGGGDVQLGCLGIGVVEAGQTAVLGGTFWQQVVNLPTAVTDPAMHIRINPHVIPGMVQAESISFFTGLTMRWFRDTFCDEEKNIAARLGIDTYSLLEQMANRIPVGSNGIMPVFSDVMHFDKWYHAAPSFINLSIDSEKCNKASMFRALQENAAIVSLLNLEQVAHFSGVKADSLVFAGGGSKGKLWSQILADVTGTPVNVPIVKEATALGCAIAAGVGCGIYDSLVSAGKNLVRWESHYQPNADNHKLYQHIKSNWQSIYAKQLSLVDDKLTTPLWRAPGI